MNKFEVMYEYNGTKTWENVFANNKQHAKELILSKNNGNNIIFLSVELVNGR